MILKKAFILPEITLNQTLTTHRAATYSSSAGTLMSKAAGCLKNIQAWGKKAIYSSLLQSPTHCAHSTELGQWEGGGRNLRNRWCSWGAKTTGWFSQFCPTTNQFCEERGERILVILLAYQMERLDHCTTIN